MYNIAICDDEKFFSNNIEKRVTEYCKEKMLPFQVISYTNSKFLLEDIEGGIKYDIFLLDIEMPNLNGLELAMRIREYLMNSVIIFITSHQEYMEKSFELYVLRYVSKANIDTKLVLALDAAVALLSSKTDAYYVYSTAKSVNRIYYNDVRFIYKNSKNTVFRLVKGEIKERKTLEQIYSLVNEYGFIYINRGNIVNLVHIKEIVGRELIITGGDILPISDTYYLETKNRISKYWRQQL